MNNNTTTDQRVILSLDTAESTGYAIYQGGEIVIHGVWKLPKEKKQSALFDRLEHTVATYGITHIVAEDIFCAFTTDEKQYRKNVSVYGGLSQLRGIIEAVAQRHNLVFNVIQPVKVKEYMWNARFYDLRGKPKNISREEQKQKMIKAVAALGYELMQTKEGDESDDEADAIGILITYVGKGNIIHPIDENHT